MHKFISNQHKLSIDLTDVNITTNEDNNWFSDNFFVKYSYPFDITLTPELNATLGDLLSNNSVVDTYIDGDYYFYDKIERAVLVVEGIEGNTATLALKYGYDDFPNFSKKLQEIGLETYNVSNIYTYANTLVNKRYPEVAVNFPQIVTDKYSADDTIWKYFEGKLNNRRNNEFIINTVGNDDELINKNIIHPCVYLLHVIQKGFESAGYTVSGEFMDNNLAHKIMLFAEKDLFVKHSSEPIRIDITSEDTPNEVVIKKGRKRHYYLREVKIQRKGKYNLIGQLSLLGLFLSDGGICVIMVNSTIVKTYYTVLPKEDFYIDEILDLLNENDILSIHLTSYTAYDNSFVQFAQLQLLPIYYINNSGNRESFIVNSNTINIGQSCPDITFGQLITTVVNLFNLDLTVENNNITLDYKVNSIYNNEVHDFRNFEKTNPKIDFKTGVKYLIAYEENEDEKTLDRILIDINGSKIIKPIEKIEDIENTISIGAYPLQIDINTVKAINQGADKINLLLYAGLQGGENYAEPPSALQLSNIYEYYYKEWITNRIKARAYAPTFTCKIEDILKLKVKDRIFMYNNYHLLQSISRQQVSKDLFEIELQTETIKVD